LNRQLDILSGTVVWVAPFYNRSGYGVGARAFVSALHRKGMRIRTVSVNEVEPGIDDCDLELIKSLETTQVIPPVTAIVSHVPSRSWLTLKLPEPNLRIMFTTFDSSAQGNLPPPEWMSVFKEMDQIWLGTTKEKEVFVSAGLPTEKIQIVRSPHPWQDNPSLPPVTGETAVSRKKFRFLSIAMFLPRRRWDTLIEAYLEEFKGNANVELYLKVNYPSWHPVPGKPRHDLHELIRSLRLKTGSQAAIIVDEELGTRMGIVHLIDSCNVYISTDTSATAPVGEALVRRRLVIIPDGLGFGIATEDHISIPVAPHAKTLLTQDMLLYQPHHKGAFMPQLYIKDVRNAMRRAYDMPPNEREAKGINASICVFSPTNAVTEAIGAINSGWQYKLSVERDKNAGKVPTKIAWEGSQFVYHSLALINRELCLQLMDSDYEISIIPYEPDQFCTEVDPRFKALAGRINKPLTGKADVHVRHQWPPKLIPPPEGHWVIIQPWEFGSLPEKWVQVFSTQIDEMWVPSNYVRQVYIDSGIPPERVVVIPNGINPVKFHPEVKPYQLKTPKKFKFLFVGGTIYRKGIDLLLQAYLDTFKRSDDVCLVIKDMGGNSFYAGQTFKEQISKIQQNKDTPEIEYILETLTEDELIGLYTACNVLTHPYRGEGFGLPIIEAMACGIPPIVTNGGACLDFCNSTNSLLVKAHKKSYPEKKVGDIITINYPWMYEIQTEDLKEKMRYAYEHTEEMRTMGKGNSENIRKCWTWSNAAQKLKDRIEYLRRVSILRYIGNSSNNQTNIFEVTDLFKKADALFQKGAYRDAIDTYRKVIEKDSSPIKSESKTDSFTLNSYHNIAIAYTKINRHEDAIITFKKILELNCNDAFAQNNLGVLYFKKNMLKEARDCFEKAVALDTNYNEAQLNLEKISKCNNY